MNGARSVYPERGRTAWILAQRPPRLAASDADAPQGIFLERERLASGDVVDSGVVLLTNRECPWRCLMCDLWKHTTRETVPAGAIPRQVAQAVRTWAHAGRPPAQVKLYNSGSFFDPAAIPPGDYAAIAREVSFARNIVVESHPRLVGERVRAFRDLLGAPLEVAMGLETAHPEALAKLNKQFDLGHFARAAEYLAGATIGLRVFLLVYPPFVASDEAAAWVVKSAEFAFACGASAVTLIPTRPGNGAIERLLENGEFALPTLSMLEDAQRAILKLGQGRVFVDTWDLARFSRCAHCFDARRARLEEINFLQENGDLATCDACGR